jgi:hypothetical protein
MFGERADVRVCLIRLTQLTQLTHLTHLTHLDSPDSPDSPDSVPEVHNLYGTLFEFFFQRIRCITSYSVYYVKELF